MSDLLRKYFRYNFILFFLVFFSQTINAKGSLPFKSEQIFKESTELFLQKKYYKSAVLLRQLILADRQKSMYWFNFANCLSMMKRYSAAIKYYDHVIKLNTKFVAIAKINKAKALTALGRNDEASALLEVVKNEPAPLSLQKLAEVELSTLREISLLEVDALQKYQTGDFQLSEVLLRSIREEQLSNDALILYSLVLLKQNKKKWLNGFSSLTVEPECLLLNKMKIFFNC